MFGRKMSASKISGEDVQLNRKQSGEKYSFTKYNDILMNMAIGYFTLRAIYYIYTVMYL